ncbi:MAG TPA: aminotransferase class V-fold PLP-dependent enzyme [Gemmatimonadales bacterium]|nr:aminotransferase class V-fold PLP-dependent enzyme [Gemmatimonadales bacterium]
MRWTAAGCALAWLTGCWEARSPLRSIEEHWTEPRGGSLLGAEPEERVPVFSFTLEGVPAAGIVRALDRLGIAVRGGDLAALPLLRRFGTATAARASCYLYTDVEEVDALVAALDELARRRSDRKENPR